MCRDSSAMMWGQAGGESAEPCWALLREKVARPCYKFNISKRFASAADLSQVLVSIRC